VYWSWIAYTLSRLLSHSSTSESSHPTEALFSRTRAGNSPAFSIRHWVTELTPIIFNNSFRLITRFLLFI
jgi:hypothetical protein